MSPVKKCDRGSRMGACHLLNSVTGVYDGGMSPVKSCDGGCRMGECHLLNSVIGVV